MGATSANLGPGFDCLGLALGIHDEISVEVLERPDVVVEVSGEGADELAGAGERHLVVRAIRHAFDVAGAPQPSGLHLVCRNAIPHGRGLGSSAAAVVGGLVAGRDLVGADALDDHLLLRAATQLEGHPDNAAAALLGGLTIAWGPVEEPDAVRLAVHPDVAAVLLVPTTRLATHQARSVLPASVSHEDAAVNVARTALLVHALTTEPSLLLPATHDRLHQRQRAAAMPETIALVERLRRDGLAAVVSGAGPSVLVLTTSARLDSHRQHSATAAGPGWQCLTPDVGGPGAATVG
ncbi:homoserine kinase [Angustibacter sp. Root456]|uniref:homoserine kinase n=1 Tax=Angustibacter sp. Root456 TaxID=1736539 RepID=UPI0019100D4A|nr:homoserine kinase [Angustibacter sp. Root456]